MLRILFFGILGWAQTSQAAVKTACPNGCDYGTIQACANTAQAGQTCLLSAGSYDEYVIVTNAGAQNNPIIFQPSGTLRLARFNITGKN